MDNFIALYEDEKFEDKELGRLINDYVMGIEDDQFKVLTRVSRGQKEKLTRFLINSEYKLNETLKGLEGQGIDVQNKEQILSQVSRMDSLSSTLVHIPPEYFPEVAKTPSMVEYTLESKKVIFAVKKSVKELEKCPEEPSEKCPVVTDSDTKIEYASLQGYNLTVLKDNDAVIAIDTDKNKLVLLKQKDSSEIAKTIYSAVNNILERDEKNDMSRRPKRKI